MTEPVAGRGARIEVIAPSGPPLSLAAFAAPLPALQARAPPVRCRAPPDGGPPSPDPATDRLNRIHRPPPPRERDR